MASTSVHTIQNYFIFTVTAPTEIYTLSLHDALPISHRGDDRLGVLLLDLCPVRAHFYEAVRALFCSALVWLAAGAALAQNRDRKSTRLNSSHSSISYAVFCLKKKNIRNRGRRRRIRR